MFSSFLSIILLFLFFFFFFFFAFGHIPVDSKKKVCIFFRCCWENSYHIFCFLCSSAKFSLPLFQWRKRTKKSELNDIMLISLFCINFLVTTQSLYSRRHRHLASQHLRDLSTLSQKPPSHLRLYFRPGLEPYCTLWIYRLWPSH